MIRQLLSVPAVYNLHNRVFNASEAFRRVAAGCGYEPGMAVLDIGCGPGTLAAYALPEDSTGIDVSAEYVEHARRHHGGTFQVLPAERVGELHARFDLAVMVGVFHHLSDQQVQECLAGLARVLDPAGRFRLLEAVWPSHWYDLPGWLLRKLDRGHFVRSRDQWCRLLSNSGWGLADMRVTRNRFLEYFECSLTPPVTVPAPMEVAPQASGRESGSSSLV